MGVVKLGAVAIARRVTGVCVVISALGREFCELHVPCFTVTINLFTHEIKIVQLMSRLQVQHI